MKYLFVFSIMLLFTTQNLSQEFEKIIIDTPDSDRLNANIIDSRGEMVIVGTRTNSDIFIIKTDLNGNIKLNKLYDSDQVIRATSIVEAHDGGYLILGVIWKEQSPELDMKLIKTDFEGEIEWIKEIDNYVSDYGFQLLSHDNGYMICGYSRTSSTSESNTYLINIDIDGNVNWQLILDDEIEGTDNQIIRTSENNWIVCGSGYTSVNGSDYHVAKISNSGDVLWSEFYTFCDQGNTAYLTSVTESTDNKYILTGYTNKCESENFQQVMMKLDTNGELLWEIEFGGEFVDRGRNIMFRNDELIVAGQSYKDTILSVSTIKSFDLNGLLNWEHDFEFDEVSNPKTINSKGDTIYVMGNIWMGDQNEKDFYLIKWYQESLTTSTVPFSSVEENVLVYPNPIGSKFTINFDSTRFRGNLEIRVFDVSGKELSSINKWKSNFRLDVELSNEELNSKHLIYTISDEEGRRIKSGVLRVK